MLTSPINTPSPVIQAAETLRRAWTAAGVQTSPHTAVILGSGLRRAANDALLSGAVAVPYACVPGMPVTRVKGHHGQFVAGGKQLARTVLLQGRSHIYEGWTPTEATYSVRILAELGVRTLIITNAAGGISPDMRPGDLMTITDHLSFVDISVRAIARSSGLKR
jgi:purine-nucleoside phosphorylase